MDSSSIDPQLVAGPATLDRFFGLRTFSFTGGGSSETLSWSSSGADSSTGGGAKDPGTDCISDSCSPSDRPFAGDFPLRRAFPFVCAFGARTGEGVGCSTGAWAGGGVIGSGVDQPPGTTARRAGDRATWGSTCIDASPSSSSSSSPRTASSASHIDVSPAMAEARRDASGVKDPSPRTASSSSIRKSSFIVTSASGTILKGSRLLADGWKNAFPRRADEDGGGPPVLVRRDRPFVLLRKGPAIVDPESDICGIPLFDPVEIVDANKGLDVEVVDANRGLEAEVVDAKRDLCEDVVEANSGLDVEVDANNGLLDTVEDASD